MLNWNFIILIFLKYSCCFSQEEYKISNITALSVNTFNFQLNVFCDQKEQIPMPNPSLFSRIVIVNIVTLGLRPNANEFIVTFNGYHSKSTRCTIIDKYLQHTYLNYSIVDRDYGNNFKIDTSDFDLIQIYNSTRQTTADLITHLSSAIQVKRVFREQPFHRQLSLLNPFVNPAPMKPQKTPPKPGTVPLDKNNQPWRLLSTAESAWASGFCGEGVRVGVFDTGLVDTTQHPHFRSAVVKERTNWTFRRSPSSSIDKTAQKNDNPGAVDGHGHGTFVTGIIAATPSDNLQKLEEEVLNDETVCPPPGLAPASELYIFRVFTDSQLSMTSWFLDAFNYAIIRRLHVINLSIGGPDFLDIPFVDKVNELSANGILLVSAIGNDGPLFGTLNNPADQMDVLGVGGVDARGDVAKFSSRGMTAWEMQNGYGRVKPDISTWAIEVLSSSLDGGCKRLSGTSVASPIVTGTVALLISAALSRQSKKNRLGQCSDCPPINPASLKQAIMSGADLVTRNLRPAFEVSPADLTSPRSGSILEQGAGLLNLSRSLDIMQRLKPQASFWPSYLDLTSCPYIWPYCSQPIYATGLPIIVNVTILNSMGVNGRVVDTPVFHPYLDKNGLWLDVRVAYSKNLWPWVGYLAVYLSVRSSPNDKKDARLFSGFAEGWISLKVESEELITRKVLATELKLPIRVKVIPTPSRKNRILWDYFHNIRYPSAYTPSDDLTRLADPLDWLGDHIHTNFRDLYEHFRATGYFVEVLQKPFTCFDAANYGTLMIVDSEDEFAPLEIEKLREDVFTKGLSLLIFGSWYNTTVQQALRFYDPNTKRIWTPATGGSNIPALNLLLAPFNIQFGDTIVSGTFEVGKEQVFYPSGNTLSVFPTTKGSFILRRRLADIGEQIIERQRRMPFTSSHFSFNDKQKALLSGLRTTTGLLDSDPNLPLLGVWKDESSMSGKIAVMGDANCIDSMHLAKNCFWLVDSLLQFVTSGHLSDPLATELEPSDASKFPLPLLFPPKRLPGSNLHQFSQVIATPFIEDGRRVDADSIFRPLQKCSFSPTQALVAPTSSLKDVIYAPQPLLLHPPLPPRIDKEGQSICHSNLQKVASRGFTSISSNLLAEYYWFLIGGSMIFALLLNLERIQAKCSVRNLKTIVFNCVRRLSRQSHPAAASGEVERDIHWLDHRHGHVIEKTHVGVIRRMWNYVSNF